MFTGQPQQEQHEMHLVKTHDTGAEEWHCPTCGRRFLLYWPPDYRKEIIEAGDEFAIHTGGKGGLQLSDPHLQDRPAPQPEFDPTPEPDVELSPELRAALEEVLADIDFGDWPGDDAAGNLL
jgi:hypothetical protein